MLKALTQDIMSFSTTEDVQQGRNSKEDWLHLLLKVHWTLKVNIATTTTLGSLHLLHLPLIKALGLCSLLILAHLTVKNKITNSTIPQSFSLIVPFLPFSLDSVCLLQCGENGINKKQAN